MVDQAAYGRPPWKVRRRLVIVTLAFCAGVIMFLIGWGEDTELNRAIATGAMLLSGSVLGSYVFGAAWDDKNVMAQLGPAAYHDQVQVGGPAYPPDIATPEGFR